METIPGVPRQEDHRRALDDVMPKALVNYEPLKEALIERKVRKGMEREGLQRIPLYPEGRPCPAPTTDKVLEVRADLEEDRLIKAREVERVVGPELTAQPTRDAEARRDARRRLHALSVRPVRKFEDCPWATLRDVGPGSRRKLNLGRWWHRVVVYWALRHPIQSWRYLRSPTRLAALLGGQVKAGEVKGWMSEASRITEDIRKRMKAASWSPGQITGATDSQDRGPVLYAVTRALRPELAIETGVANGSSSYYFLSAMRANGSGKLHSIDLPPGTSTQSEYHRTDVTAIARGHESGWLVPEELRSMWELHLGDTRVILPKVLASTPEIDLFFHDSEHTYEAMTFEFRSAWPRLRPGGLLGSDDVSWNRSFFDFVEAQRLPTVLVGGFGFTRKSPSTT